MATKTSEIYPQREHLHLKANRSQVNNIEASDNENITIKLQNASLLGGIIQLPSGTFYSDFNLFKSKCTIRGKYQEENNLLQTTIKRIQTSQLTLFSAENKTDVHFENLRLEISASSNFTTGINLKNSKNCSAKNCYIYTDFPVPHFTSSLAWSIYGIIADNSEDLTIEKNHLHSSQIEIKNNFKNILINLNTSSFAHNIAINCTSINSSNICENLIISNNKIISAWSGSIFVGANSDTETGSNHYNFTIENNEIKTNGEWAERPVIRIRLGKNDKNLKINNNIISLQSSSILPHCPISIKGEEGYVDYLEIKNNIISCSHSSYSISSSISGSVIKLQNNYLSGGNGILFKGNKSNIFIDTIDNTIFGKKYHHSLNLEVTNSNININLRNNNLINFIDRKITTGTINIKDFTKDFPQKGADIQLFDDIFTLKTNVAYLIALDPWVLDNVWSIAAGQEKQIMVPTFKQPTKHGSNPLFEDGGFNTTLFCPDGKFRMWYMTQVSINGTPEIRDTVCIVTSSNGIQWHFPNTGMFTNDISVHGSGNLCWRGVNDVFASGISVILAPEDEEKFKYIMCYRTQGGFHITGCETAEGISWSKTDDIVQNPLAVDTNLVIARATDDTSWFLLSRPDDWGSTDQDIIDEGQQRRVAVTLIPKLFETRTNLPKIVLRVDEQDKLAFGWHHIYSTTLTKHDSGLYISYLNMFHNNDFIIPDLAWSRDCYYWYRPSIRFSSSVTGSSIINTPINFIPLGPSGSWDSSMIFPSTTCYLEVGDEWWIYYAGWDGTHETLARQPQEAIGTPNRRVVRYGLATMRREGLACYQGPKDGCVISTKPLIWPDADLFVNTIPGTGSVKVRIMRGDRRHPITSSIYGAYDGFSFNECDAITSNDTRYIVSWLSGSSDMRSFAGQTIRIEFYLEDSSELFSFGAID